ncbi:hypothetical protein BKA65DRAFT_194776 [Rhexocercosporidium sp. MPI-PUGE-AT-0058]|nr:hypothetical protein BKA65DRAFT_194776 [Rhexocercosporidium sp. MPI-PUGE-AT-0058]
MSPRLFSKIRSFEDMASQGGPSNQLGARCRTCQKRKVKCGREQPVCINCQRLGLTCEKPSKYRWRDQTMSTRVSLSGVTSEKSSIWDPKTDGRAIGDDFPEEVQDAAETSGEPGDRFINTTPANYHELYKSEGPSRPPSGSGSIITIPAASFKLERFEDYAYSPTASRRTSVMKIEPSTTERSIASLSTGMSLARRMDRSFDVNFARTNHPSMFDQALIHNRDLHYYNHYRTVVVYNIQVNSKFPETVRPFCHSLDETEDPFERAASSFNPLYNAMLALSAVSMANRERLDRLDSLGYYQLAVEGLRQHSSLESVNMIYTHYFLLLYEIAACENRANLELNHMAQLTRLLAWYFTTSEVNPAYVFRDQECQKCTEVSMNCIPSNMLYCDMYNLILHRQESIIVPDVMVCGFFNAVHEQNHPHLEAGFGDPDLSRKTIMLNIFGGWAHRVVRNMLESANKKEFIDVSELEPGLQDLNAKIKVLDDYCAEIDPRLPVDIYDEAYTRMPVQCQTTFDSAQFTVRQLLIYAHTSILPQQRRQLTKRREEYIQYVAREILYLTRPRWGETRPIAASNLVALFMCGTVVTSKEDKEEVLRVLAMMGADASGRNFVRSIDALKALFKEQERVKQGGGDEKEVDWFVFLREKGLLDFSLFGI